jgi:hypothetical protein
MSKNARKRKAAKKAKKGMRQPSNVSRGPKKGARSARKQSKKNHGIQPAFMRGNGPLGLSGGGSYATSRRSQVIEEDEYIGEVNGSVAFATTAYPLNPGQSGTFPWGNKIAQLYEKYDFEFVEFYYKREVSEYASNGQTGKVILSFDYDASDSAPTTKQQVEDTVPHIDGMPCTATIRLPIDCRCVRNGPARYVRPGGQPAGTDIKTYDAGNLYVSTQGCAGTTTIGELRVRYRCRFSEPVLEAAIVAAQNPNVGHFSNGANSATASNPMQAGVLQTGSTIPVQTVNAGGYLQSQFTCVAGTQYVVNVVWSGASSIAAVPTVTGSVGCTLTGLWSADTTSNYAFFLAAGTSASISYTFIANVSTSFGVHCTYGGLTGMTGANFDLWISALPTALLTSSVNGRACKTLGDSSSYDTLYELVMSQQSALSRLENILANRSLLSESDYDDEKDAATSDLPSTSPQLLRAPGRRRRELTPGLESGTSGVSTSAPPSKGWFKA